MAGQTSPPIAYKCPNCKTKLESPAELAGKEDTCPQCGNTCAVPKTKQQKTEERQRLRQQEEAERQKQAKIEQARLQSIRQAKTEIRVNATRAGSPVAWKPALIGGVVGAIVVGLISLLIFEVIARQQTAAIAKQRQLAVQRAEVIAKAAQAAKLAAQAKAARLALLSQATKKAAQADVESEYSQNMSVGAMIQAAKRDVCLLKVYNDNGDLLGNGSAFVVDGEGDAVTNFHVVHDVSSAKAKFTWSTEVFPVHLMAVSPTEDLALIRIDFTHSSSPKPLRLSTSAPQSGEAVWALGYPLELGFTVTKGIVSGLRTYHDLPAGLQKGSNYAPGSRWVQTDCTTNAGNSGGPLLNRQGAVVGINTWSFVKSYNGRVNNAYFALDARDVECFLANPRHVAITFAGAITQFGQEKTGGNVSPRIMPRVAAPSRSLAKRRRESTLDPTSIPSIKIPAIAPVSNFTVPAFLLRRLVERQCPECNGTGRIRVTSQTGWNYEGTLKYPVYSTYIHVCPECGGTGIIHGSPGAVHRALVKLVNQLARAVIKTQLDQTSFQRGVRKLEDVARVMTVGQAATTDEDAKRQLSFFTPTKMMPICATGKILRVIRLSNSALPIRIVVLDGSDQLVIITNPRIADDVNSGAVLVGGLYTGKCRLHDGRHAAVLQNGFFLTFRP